MTLALRWLRGDEQLEVTFDAVPSITPVESAAITRHPVEKGADVTDHIQLSARRLSFEALVTNTPHATPETQTQGAKGEVRGLDMGQVGHASVLQWDGEMQRPRDVYLELRDAYLAKSVFTVITALEPYYDMVITGLSSPREAGSGRQTQDGGRIDWLKFSVELEQIRVVGSKEGKATRTPKETKAAKPKKNKGSKPKAQATEKDNRTIAAAGFDSIAGR